MDRVFADTDFWVAALHPGDVLHERAIAAAQALDGAEIITTEMVLTEMLGYFAPFPEPLRNVAVRYTERIRNDRGIKVVPRYSTQFRDALEVYYDVGDKTWSLVDCASFLVMRKHHLEAALTAREEFTEAGYRALLAVTADLSLATT